MVLSPKVIDAFLTGTVWTCYELGAYWLWTKVRGKREVSSKP